MHSPIKRLLSLKLAGRGKMVVGDDDADKEDKTGVKLTAAMFFDGTLNNRANTRLRLTKQEELTIVEQRTHALRQQAEANAKGATARLRTAVGSAQRAEAEPEATAAQDALATATREHEAAAAALKAYKKKIDGKSGANFYSNVSILGEMTLIEDDSIGISHYVEGIGTTDGGSDDMHGSAFGAGYSGIVAKVNKGIREMSAQLQEKYNKKEQYIEELRIDVFGFSRGAAAARHFVARKHLHHGGASAICQALGLSDPAVVKFRFVGLFESVSSYNPGKVELHRDFKGPLRVLNRTANAVDILANAGPAVVAIRKEVDPAFADDVEELGLRVEEEAKKVVHFTAADEYRRNFPSTDIRSALAARTGCELELPGAHSDIGGGYGEWETETREMRLRERHRLAQEGWYPPAAEALADHDGDGPKVTATREGLPNDYQYVPLALMRELAERNGMKFESLREDKFKGYAVPPLLQAVHAALRTKALDHYGSGSLQKKSITLPPEQLRWL
ncbi:MAG TPA: hypothetical protein VF690_15210, partial [Hymenobacter sp.]